MTQWSKTPPQTEGWYWRKGWNCFEFSDWNKPAIEVVEVIKRPGHDYLCILNPTVCQHTKRDFLSVTNLHNEWSGPIPKPEESK